MNTRQLFLTHTAQTSPAPIGLEIVRASGIYQYAADGKAYVDLIAGFSVANIGHGHPAVVQAVQQQAADYMHLIVYGEFIQAPQVQYARRLAEHLPGQLGCVYFTNSGAEATEGAIKLARRLTGRTGIIAFHKAYHGSTNGALSLMGDEYFRNAYRPLLPGITHHHYNDPAVLQYINSNTACVILETVQAESGVTRPEAGWLQAVARACQANGALLILDEIQAGFGRTGSLFAFEQYGVVPDILLLGKALGGGMPLGAFLSSYQNMQAFTHNPVLGHITTFGGHPVSCTAGLAAFEVLLQEPWIARVQEKEQLIRQVLQHPAVRLTTAGLWAAVHFADAATCHTVVKACWEAGIITDWFLFAPQCLRIAPPLSISHRQLQEACEKIRDIIATVTGIAG
jgi:acetylornithine/N-succinyldiaminopimelate aminotransferase